MVRSALQVWFGQALRYLTGGHPTGVWCVVSLLVAAVTALR